MVFCNLDPNFYSTFAIPRREEPAKRIAAACLSVLAALGTACTRLVFSSEAGQHLWRFRARLVADAYPAYARYRPLASFEWQNSASPWGALRSIFRCMFLA